MTSPRYPLRGAGGLPVHNASGIPVAVPCPCCPRLGNTVIVTVSDVATCSDCWSAFADYRKWLTALTDPNGVFELVLTGPFYPLPATTACHWVLSRAATGTLGIWTGDDTCTADPPDSTVNVATLDYDLWLYPSGWQFFIRINGSLLVFSDDSETIPSPCDSVVFTNTLHCNDRSATAELGSATISPP